MTERVDTAAMRRLADTGGIRAPGHTARLLLAAADELDALRAAAAWQPTHQHVRRGSEYQALGKAVLQTGSYLGDETNLMIYRDKDGRLWARPVSEFGDGRFVPLPTPPDPAA